jgi:hypothetical protein
VQISSLPGPFHNAMKEHKNFTLQFNLAENKEVGEELDMLIANCDIDCYSLMCSCVVLCCCLCCVVLLLVLCCAHSGRSAFAAHCSSSSHL